MKNQKGFISILMIVIVSIIVASAGTGAVLHKQGKLKFSTANISEVFEQTKDDVIAIEAKKTNEINETELQTEIKEQEKKSDIASNSVNSAIEKSGSAKKIQETYQSENQLQGISETIQKLNTEIQNIKTQNAETQKFSQSQSPKDNEKSEVVPKIAETTITTTETSTEKPACVFSQEICDNKDNDCDNEIDENITRNCGISNIGVCQFGIQICEKGKWGECVGAIEPTQEICDQKDNDCDGQIDEENVCGISNAEADPCVNVDCPVCQYCSNGNCVARPNSYNDCGSGCQRCVNGSCQDYNDVCFECQHCSSDVCVNYCQGNDSNCGCINCVNCNTNDGCVGNDYHDYFCDGTSCETNIAYNSENCITCGDCQHYLNGSCQNYCDGTDTSCGCDSCVNCNNLDGCSENSYLDYSCSENFCISDSDDCSDCSCSCGGYNVAESIENENCNDGKDNDCDGNVDLVDSECNSKDDNCHVRLLWEQGYCTPNCKCKIGQGPCNSDYDCENGHCAKYAGKRYGQLESIGVCEEVPSIKILSPTENEEWEKDKTYTIKWDYHGLSDIPLSIYIQPLFSSNSSAFGITSEIIGQVGEYQWTIPNSIEAGKFWTLKIGGLGIPSDSIDYLKIVGKNIPTVKTGAVTDIKSDYANLYGSIISLDGISYYSHESLAFWFEWGETPLLGQRTNSQHPRGNSWTLLHDSISGLLQNTTYYFKVAIQSDDGVNYGEVKSFTTKSAFPPTVSTLSRCPMQGREFTTDIMADSDGSTAFCGHITDLGGARFFETWFEWGETTSLGYETVHRTNIFLEYDDTAYPGYESRFFGDRATPESIYSSSSYCFRVVAKNNGGVSYGEIICF